MQCIPISGQCEEACEGGNCEGSREGKKVDHFLDASLAPSIARMKEAGRRGMHRKSKSGIPKPPRSRLSGIPGTSTGSASCGDLDFGGFQCEDWTSNLKIQRPKSQIPSPPSRTEKEPNVLRVNRPRKVSSTQEIVSLCPKSFGSVLESFGCPESVSCLDKSKGSSTSFASLESLIDSSFDEDPLCKGNLETLVQFGPEPSFMNSGDIRSVVDRLLDVEGMSDKDPSSWLFDLETDRKQNYKGGHSCRGLKMGPQIFSPGIPQPYQISRKASKKIQSEIWPDKDPAKLGSQDCEDKNPNRLTVVAKSACTGSGGDGEADLSCKLVGVGKGISTSSSKNGSRIEHDESLDRSSYPKNRVLDSGEPVRKTDCSPELVLLDSSGSSVLEWNISSPRQHQNSNTRNECDPPARGSTSNQNEAPFIFRRQVDAGIPDGSFSPLLPECLWSASGLSCRDISNAWTKWSTLSSQSYCALPGQTGEEYAECVEEVGSTISPLITSTASSPKFARCMMSMGSLQTSGSGSCARLLLDDLDNSINEESTVEFNIHHNSFALIEVGDLLHQFSRKNDLRSFIHNSQHIKDVPGVTSSQHDLTSVCSLSVRDWIMSSSSQRSTKDICTATTIGSTDCITSWPPLTELHIKEGFKSNGPNPLWMSRGQQPDGVLVSREGDMLWNDQVFHCSNGTCYPWVSRAGCTSGKARGEVSPWAGSVGRDVTCLSSSRQLWYSPPKIGFALKWVCQALGNKLKSPQNVMEHLPQSTHHRTENCTHTTI